MTLLSEIPVAERLECRQKERRGSWQMGHCHAKVRDRHCQAEKRSKRMDDDYTKQDRNGRKYSRASRRNRYSKDGSRCQEKYQYPSRFISRSPPAAASRCTTSGFGRHSKPLQDSRPSKAPLCCWISGSPLSKSSSCCHMSCSCS